MDLLTLMLQPFSFELLKSKQGREILKTHTHVCAFKFATNNIKNRTDELDKNLKMNKNFSKRVRK